MHTTILGSARVLQGSSVRGKSVIEGGPTLEFVQVDGGHVCGSYIIRNHVITSNYFCVADESEDLSNISISSSNFHKDRLNPFPNFLEFKSSDYNFNRNNKNTVISVNDLVVSSDKIKVSGDTLRVYDVTNLQEGENNISITGLDEYGKRIEEKSFEGFFGSKKIQVQITSGSSSLWDFTVAAKLGMNEFAIGYVWRNGVLELQGIPNDFPETAVLNVIGYSADEVFWGSWPLNSIPSEVSPITVQKFSNNSGDFSDLSGWSFSHEENVVIDSYQGSRRMMIYPHPEQEVVVTKRFRLNRGKVALGASLEVNTIFGTVEGFPDLDLGLFSFGEKSKKLYRLTADNVSSFIKPSNGITKFETSFSKRDKETEVLVIVKLKPSSVRTSALIEPFVFKSFSVDFDPYDLTVYNLPQPPGTPTLVVPSTQVVSNCEDPDFAVENDDDDIQVGFNSIARFFSGGKFTYWIPEELQENRIWGDLTVRADLEDNVKIKDLNFSSIKLVGLQEGEEIFSKEISKCAGKKISSLSGLDVLKYERVKNRAQYLFALTGTELESVVTDGGNVNLRVNVKGSYKVETNEGDVEGQFDESSPLPVTSLQVLSIPDLTQSYYSALPDNWDSDERNKLRTGGEKWTLPAYLSNLEEIITGSNWRVNDVSKVNGGQFKGHSLTGHQRGIDADVNFPSDDDLNHNFKGFGNDYNKWRRALYKSDVFIEGLGDQVSYINTIYVTSKGYQNSELFRNRFQNRCLGGRFIDLDMSIIDWNSVKDLRLMRRTLLREQVEHHHHFHIEFNEPLEGNLARRHEPQIPNIELEQIEFRISNRQFEIFPRNQSFQEFAILWRAQETSSYEDITERVYFGKWDDGKITIPTTQPPLPNDKVLNLDIVVAHKPSGGCKVFKRIIQL